MSYYLCSPCCIDTPIRARDPMGLPNDFEGCNGGERHSRMVITAISTTQTAAQRRHWMSVYYFRFRIYSHLGVVPWILIQYFIWTLINAGAGVAVRLTTIAIYCIIFIPCRAEPLDTSMVGYGIWVYIIMYSRNDDPAWAQLRQHQHLPEHPTPHRVILLYCGRSVVEAVLMRFQYSREQQATQEVDSMRSSPETRLEWMRGTRMKLHTSQTIFHSSAILFHHRRIFLADHSSLNDDLKYVQSRRRVYPSLFFVCHNYHYL